MTTPGPLRHFWRLPLFSALILIGSAAAADPLIPVGYELIRPSLTFGDQWQVERALVCGKSSSADPILGSVQSTTKIPITLTAFLSNESGDPISQTTSVPLGIGEVKKFAVGIPDFCTKPLPSRLYLVTSATPDPPLEGYVASVPKWEPLIGGRSVGSAALSWSASVGSRSVSPAWLYPTQLVREQVAVANGHVSTLPGEDFLLTRASDARQIRVELQTFNQGFTYLKLADYQRLMPGKYEGMTPFVADGKPLTATLNVREQWWKAIGWLILSAALGWMLNWVRTRLLPSLEMRKALQMYQEDLPKRFFPQSSTPDATIGYTFLATTMTELDALEKSAGALASPLNNDLPTLTELKAALSTLKQRELDWQEAYILLGRLDIGITLARDTLGTAPPMLINALATILTGYFNSPVLKPPCPFDAALWLQLAPTLKTALELTRLMQKYPFYQYSGKDSALVQKLKDVLAQSPGDPIALEAAKADYSLAGAALAAAQPPFGFFIQPKPIPSEHRGFEPSMVYPERWPLQQLIAVRNLLGIFVALIIIVFTVFSGYQTQYLANSTWGASWLDYFTALGWGVGLSGSLNLIFSVIENLRFTGKPTA